MAIPPCNYIPPSPALGRRQLPPGYTDDRFYPTSEEIRALRPPTKNSLVRRGIDAAKILRCNKESSSDEGRGDFGDRLSVLDPWEDGRSISSGRESSCSDNGGGSKGVIEPVSDLSNEDPPGFDNRGRSEVQVDVLSDWSDEEPPSKDAREQSLVPPPNHFDPYSQDGLMQTPRDPCFDTRLRRQLNPRYNRCPSQNLAGAGEVSEVGILALLRKCNTGKRGFSSSMKLPNQDSDIKSD